MNPQRIIEPEPIPSPPPRPGTDFQAVRNLIESAPSPNRADALTTQALATPPGESSEPDSLLPPQDNRKRYWRFGILGATLVVGLVAIALLTRHAPDKAALDNVNQQYGTQSISLGKLHTTGSSLGNAGTVSINGRLQVGSTLVLTPMVQPSNAVAGQLYYDATTNQLSYFNGQSFATILSSRDKVVQSINGLTGVITTGTGLNVAGNVMTNAGVLSLQGQTGSVTLTPGGGIAINGTTIANTGVLAIGGQAGTISLGGGLTAANGTLTNNGVLSLGGQNGAIALGGGLSLAGNQLQNNGVLSVIAGSNITVTNDGNGNVTVSTTGGAGGSGGVGGSGTGGTLALWSGSGAAGNLTDSLLSQSGTTVTVAGTLSATSLTGDGSGVTNVNAAQLGGQAGSYYTNASNISTGTLNDGRLSANVALYNQAISNFLGTLQQNGSDVCTVAGNCTGVAGGSIGGGGTANKVALFTGSGYSVGNSILSQDAGATTVSITGDLAVTGAVSATTLTGNGSGVTNVNAAQLGGQAGSYYTNAGNLSSGTLSNSRLNSDVATYDNTTSNFTGALQQGGSDVCTVAGNCVGTSGGAIGGNGTANTIALFIGSGYSVGDSILTQAADASSVSIGGALNVSGDITTATGTVTAVSLVGNGSGVTNVNAAQLEGNTTSYFTNASNLSSGTLANTRLSASVTLQGNTFNGPNQLLQLNASGYLPAVNGSLLTAVNAATLEGNGASYYTDASNISSGTLADGRLSSNAALYNNTTSNFTGSLQQNGNVVCTTAGNCTSVGGGVTTPGGTANAFTIFTGAQTIGDSLMSQDAGATTVTIAGSLNVTGTSLQHNGNDVCDTSGNCVGTGGSGSAIGGSGTPQAISLFTGAGMVGDSIITQSSDASGVTVGGNITVSGNITTTTGTVTAANLAGNGAGVTNVDASKLGGQSGSYYTNATNLSSGTLSNSRLNTDVSTYDNTTSNFTGALQQGGNNVCTTAGNCVGTSGGAIGGSGSLNQIALFTGSGFTIGDSLLSQDAGATTVSVNGDLNVGGTVIATSLSGNGAGVTNVNAAQLEGEGASYYTNASNLSSGTLSDARLSSNAALYNNTTSNFTGSLQQNGADVCTTSGNCTGVSGGSIGGSGTANTLAMFTASGYTIGNSLISQDAGATTVSISGDLNVTGAVIATSLSGDGTNVTNVNAAALEGESGSYYTNAGNLSAGTLSDARLSSNAALYNNTTSNFTGNLQHNGNAVCDTSGNCAGTGGGVTSSGGTANTFAIFTGAQTIGNSLLTQDAGATTLSMGGDLSVSGSVTATSLSGNGSGVTNVDASKLGGQSSSYYTNATNLSSGTVNDNRLSTNVALHNSSNNFTGALQQNGSDVCTTAGNCVGTSGGAIGGSGTANTIALFTGSGFTIGDSLLSQDAGATTVSISGGLSVTGNITTATGTVTAANFSGNGSAVTNVNAAELEGEGASYYTNASNLSSGTLNDARLSSNVAKYGDTTANFTGDLQQNGNNVCTTAGNCVGGGGAGSSIGGSGTAGTIALFTATGTIGNSILTQTGTTDITITGSETVTGTLAVSGAGNSSFVGTVSGANATNSNQFVTLSQLNSAVGGVGGGAAIGGSGTTNTIALFTDSGTIGDSLLTQDAGATTVTMGGNLTVAGDITTTTGTITAANFNGNGSGVTNVNAAQLGGQAGSYYTNATNLSSGTLSNSRLNTDVATYDNTTSNFTGALQHNGNDVCDTTGNCAGAGGGVTDGGEDGTANTFAIFTGSQTIGNSILTQDAGATAVSIAGNLSATGTITAASFSGDGSSITNVNAAELNGQAGSYYQNATNITTGTLSNSRLTGSGVLSVSAGNGLTGGGSVALGGSTTLAVQAAAGGCITVAAGGISVTDACVNAATLGGHAASYFQPAGSYLTSESDTLATVTARGATTATASSFTGGLSVSSGFSASGTITLSSLTSAGVVHTSATGQLSTSLVSGTDIAANAVALGTQTTGNYAAGVTAGSGIAVTGTAGEGWSPTVAVDSTVCRTTNNCSASGTAGGDLSGTYPNPTVAKLQGKAITLTSLATNQLLTYNGTAWVNALLSNNNLASGSYGNITGVGALASGSIASGFGTIATANNITTTATMQGGTVNATTALQTGGTTRIDASGNLTNINNITAGGDATIAGNLGIGTTTPNANIDVEAGLPSGNAVQITSSGTATNAMEYSGNSLNVSRSVTANTTGSTGVQFDAAVTVNNASGNLTKPFTIGNHTNRFLLVEVARVDAAVPTVSYAGTPVPQIGTTGNMYIYALTDPAVGTNDLVATNTSGQRYNVGVSSWYNVNQSNPYSNFTTTSGTSNVASLTLATTAGQVVVDQFTQYDIGGLSVTPGSGQTTVYNAATAYEYLESSYGLASSSSLTISESGTANGTHTWYYAALALNPATGGLGPEITGSVANLSSNCTLVGASGCTDTSSILSLNQQYTGATGAVLSIQNAGSGDMLDFLNGSGSTVAKIDASGNISTSGTLTVTGSGNSSFVGTVSGADASANNQFVTLSQLNSAVGGVGGGSALGGSGTTNTIAMFTASGTIGNSLLTQDSGATTVTIGGSLAVTGNITTATGTVTAANFNGNGSGVTNVNAAQLGGQAGSYYTNAGNISSGTLADGRLSSNVAKYGDTTANFTGALQQGGNNVCTTAGNCVGGGGAGGAIGGGGTAGTIALFNGTGYSIADSILTQSSTTVTAAGTVAANAFQGDGSALTNLNASNLSSGTVPVARISGSYTGITGTGALAAGSINWSGAITTTGTITGATVNATTGYEANGTPGATTTCTGGNFLQNAAIQGGIVTGGTCATPSAGITGVGTYSTTNTNANGATISGNTIIFQSASINAPGMVDMSSQTFAGAKAFNGTVTVNAGLVAAAGQTITIAGGNTASRPASPTEGMVYYDTTTHGLLVYSNGKWQADRSTATKIVASGGFSGCSGSVPVASSNPDAADFVTNSCTSAQTVINAAIAALPAAGGTVYLMEGTYIVDGPISLKQNVNLVGSGPSTIIKLKSSTNTSMSLIDNAAVTGSGSVTISNLLLDGNNTNNTTGSENGIGFTAIVSAVNLTISNVTVQNVLTSGFYGYTGLTSTQITQSIFRNNLGNGVDIRNGTAVLTNLVITGNGSGSGNAAININIGVVASISNSDIENTNGDGIDTGIGGSGLVTLTGNTIKNNNYTGIELYGSSGNVVTGNTIAASTTSSSRGIVITQSTKNTISGNYISTPASGASAGIYLANSADNNNISGNKFYIQVGDGIMVGSLPYSPSNNSITDNDFNLTGSLYGININYSGATANYLSNNRFSGSTSPLRDVGTGTIYANQQDANGNLVNKSAGGGFTIGTSTVNGTLSLQGGITTAALPSPAAPTLATAGTAGTTSYTYAVTALDGTGETLASTGATIATGNATLNATNYIKVTFSPVSGATSYKVYRTASGGSPATTGLIGTVMSSGATSYTFNDTGLAASGSVPASNTTGGGTFTGALQGTILAATTGFKVAGVTGATTTCSGGQFLQNQVVQGGIVTGGTCASAAAGLTGSGTTGTIAMFSGSGTNLGNSILTQSSGTITVGGNLSATGTITTSATGKVALAITGAPAASATSSLIQVGSAIQGGNSGGTYLGVSAPSTGAGSAADFINLQRGGSSVFTVDYSGSAWLVGSLALNGDLTLQGAGTVYAAQIDSTGGAFQYNGTSGTTTTCSGGQFLQNQVVQGGIVTGGTCATAGGGVTTIGAIDGGTYSANGASISGSTMYLQAATGSHVGLVTTGAQTFAGDKSFSGRVAIGLSSPGASLDVQGVSTTSVAARISAMSGASADALEVFGSTYEALKVTSGATTYLYNGLDVSSINTASTFHSNVTLSGTGSNQLAVTGAPAASATSSLIQVGSAIQGGNSATNGGTYIGLNSPTSGAGSAADLINLQHGGSSVFTVSSQGNTYINGTLEASIATFDQGFYSNGVGDFLFQPNPYATQSAIEMGSSIQGGNASGTFIGINAATSYAGDFLNFQVNGSSKFKVDASGNITITGTSKANLVNSVTGYQFNGTAGATTTCSGGQFLQNQVVQGGITTGGTCATAGGGVTTIGALNGGTANSNGATISGSTLYLQSASQYYAGLIDTVAQTFAGAKTFNDGLTVWNGMTVYGNTTLNSKTTFSNVGGPAIVVSTAPTNSAVSSVIQLGNAIAGGNASASGGTYIGLNAPSTGAGSAADLINLQHGGSSYFQITSSGTINMGQTTGYGIQIDNTSHVINLGNTSGSCYTMFNNYGITGSGGCSGYNITSTGTAVNINNISSNALGNSTGAFYVNNGSSQQVLNVDTTTTSGNHITVRTYANSTTGFSIQNASGKAIFNVDTSASINTFGDTTSGNYITVSSTGLTAYGTARHTRALSFSPEYAGAVLDGTNCVGTANGTMTSGFDGTNSYYQWSNTQATSQCYDIVVETTLPKDFDGWATGDTMSTWSSAYAIGQVGFTLKNAGGTTDPSLNGSDVSPTSSSTWNTATLSTPTGTYSAGQKIHVVLHLSAPQNVNVRVGDIQLNYYSKF